MVLAVNGLSGGLSNGVYGMVECELCIMSSKVEDRSPQDSINYV